MSSSIALLSMKQHYLAQPPEESGQQAVQGAEKFKPDPMEAEDLTRSLSIDRVAAQNSYSIQAKEQNQLSRLSHSQLAKNEDPTDLSAAALLANEQPQLRSSQAAAQLPQLHLPQLSTVVINVQRDYYAAQQERQLPDMSFCEYALTKRGLKTLGCVVGATVGVYLMPGLFSWIKGGIQPTTLAKTTLEVARVSNRYWIATFLPQNSSLQSIVGAVWCCSASYHLYHYLITGPYFDDFAAWRLARITYIFRNRTIPERFHTDPFLSQYECPITTMPIREPARDIYGHLYEHAAILSWLRTGHDTSPLTREPLEEKDIATVPELYNQITQRLIDLGYNDVD